MQERDHFSNLVEAKGPQRAWIIYDTPQEKIRSGNAVDCRTPPVTSFAVNDIAAIKLMTRYSLQVGRDIPTNRSPWVRATLAFIQESNVLLRNGLDDMVCRLSQELSSLTRTRRPSRSFLSHEKSPHRTGGNTAGNVTIVKKIAKEILNAKS